MAKQTTWRWTVIALAFVLSLSAMVAAQRWYEGHRAQPALARLESLPGVRWARLGEGPVGRTLWVGVEPVDDVARLVGSIRRSAGSGELGTLHEIVLVDQRGPELSRALSRLQLALYEGAHSGALLRTQEHIAQEAAAMGIDEARLFADEQAVYLFLADGPRYLLEVVARPSPPTSAFAPLPLRVEGPQAALSGQGRGQR